MQFSELKVGTHITEKELAFARTRVGLLHESGYPRLLPIWVVGGRKRGDILSRKMFTTCNPGESPEWLLTWYQKLSVAAKDAGLCYGDLGNLVNIVPDLPFTLCSYLTKPHIGSDLDLLVVRRPQAVTFVEIDIPGTGLPVEFWQQGEFKSKDRKEMDDLFGRQNIIKSLKNR